MVFAENRTWTDPRRDRDPMYLATFFFTEIHMYICTYFHDFALSVAEFYLMQQYKISKIQNTQSFNIE